MARSQVPPFGDWDSEGNVPYTVFFDNARKGKKGSKLNPNDPQDFPESDVVGVKGSNERDSIQDDTESRRSVDLPLHSIAVGHKTAVDSSHQRPPEGRKGSATTPRARHERQLSREEGDTRRSTDSPHHHRHGGDSTPRRVSRQSVGSDRSVEQSPLHPQSQVRIGGKGGGGGGAVSSPSWERKGSAEGSHGAASSTPGRSRLRSVTRGDDTPDHSPAVPKFGDWDENDPASAEGYTQLFDRVREDKQTGAEKVPSMPNEGSYSNGQRRDGYNDSKSCGCFPWSRR